MNQRKIRSVNELARYQVGDVAWWVTLRPLSVVAALPDEDDWMEKHHPKVLFQWGPHRELWGKALLPKLQHMDFKTITSLLTCKLVVESFTVCDLIRSKDTGEFFYSNDDDEWMPESFLMDSKAAADRERHRILRLLKKWAEQ